MNSSRLFLSALVAGLTFALSAVPTHAQSYFVQDVGTLGGNSMFAGGINSSGQVAGTAQLADSTYRAFLFDQTGLHNLGLPTGTSILQSDSGANAINDTGIVVGSSYDASYTNINAFRYSNGAFTLLQGLPGTAKNSADIINSSGQVIGECGNGSPSVVRWEPGSTSPIDLGRFGTVPEDYAQPYGVNDLGQVVGGANFTPTPGGGQVRRAFRTSPNTAINASTDDLGTLGGSTASANAINHSGVVVGSSMLVSGRLHAFRTAANSRINAATDDLGVLPGMSESEAYGLNSRGDAVGYSGNGPYSFTPSRAVLFRNGAVIDLNAYMPSPSGYMLSQAIGINDRGQIVADGYNASSLNHVFVLTPQAQDVSNQVQVKRGGFRYNRGDDTFVQQVTLTNRSGTTIVGPVSLVLDGLVGTLVNPSATTQYTAPAGRPAFTVSPAAMAAGASLTVTLQFRPSGDAVIAYTTRVLDGQGLL